jgi:hypothetical protein
LATDITKSFRVEDGLSLNDVVGIFSGDVDPTAGAGQPAPAGSLYLRTSGTIYSKIGTGDTQWSAVAAGGTGTVMSVGIVPPTSGITVSNSPITTSGNMTLNLSDDLNAVENLTTAGLVVRTGTSTWNTRSLSVTAPILITNADGIAGNPSISMVNNPIIPGTASMTVPSGTAAQQPGVPVNGMIRYNTTTGLFEGYQSGSWVNFSIQQQTSIVQRVRTMIGAASGTTRTDLNATAPTSTTGTVIATVPFTPMYSTSTVEISIDALISSSRANNGVTISVFRGNVLVDTVFHSCAAANETVTLKSTMVDAPNTTSQVTYTFKIGVNGGGNTWYLNRTNNLAAPQGGITTPFIITEYI